MATKKAPECSGINAAYQRILDYCNQHANGQSYYRQRSFKEDFFDIFEKAYVDKCCGESAFDRYRRRKLSLKRKKILQQNWIVTGASLKQFIQRNWKTTNRPSSRNNEMIADLANWWDEWTFALDVYSRKDRSIAINNARRRNQ